MLLQKKQQMDDPGLFRRELQYPRQPQYQQAAAAGAEASKNAQQEAHKDCDGEGIQHR